MPTPSLAARPGQNTQASPRLAVGVMVVGVLVGIVGIIVEVSPPVSRADRQALLKTPEYARLTVA